MTQVEVCLPLKLIIKIDGVTNTSLRLMANDKIRLTQFKSLGFKVIRFTDDEVLTGINGVFNAMFHEAE